MADNVDLPATSVKAAADEVTWSGDTTKLQIVELATVTGAEGAKTPVLVPAGGGTEATALRVTLANDSTGTLTVDAPVGTPVFVRLSDGSSAITTLATSLATLPALVAGTAVIGDVDVAPRTTGGWSVGNYNTGDTYTALTNTAQVVKAGAGKVGGWYAYNPNTAAMYIMLYDIAQGSVTVGTSTAKMVIAVPAQGASNIELLAGVPFATAISVAAATAGGGNSAPATALEVMIFYK